MRAEVTRLLAEAKSVTDEALKKSMLVRALELAGKAEILVERFLESNHNDAGIACFGDSWRQLTHMSSFMESMY
jgi:hypothetical protein